MKVPIIIFYHCVFRTEKGPLPSAMDIIQEQMAALESSGLAHAAKEIHIGINGHNAAGATCFPSKAKVVYHGPKCRTELRTLLMIEDWCKNNSGEAFILYFHAKGSSHHHESSYAQTMSTPWRTRMMQHCIENWRRCIIDLFSHDAVGAHWLTGQGWDHSQHYFAGTFWWCRASFFRTIPSVMTRQRIKDSGLDSPDSRFEAEVVLGNGPRLPKVKNYYAGGIGT
jgi:hypothetical protein